MNSYHVNVTFVTDMLGTASADPDIYTKYQTKKHEKEMERAEKRGDKEAVTTLEAETVALADEEVAMLPEDKGITVFRRDANGTLCLTDFMIRGFLKESQEAITGQWGGKSKLDKWVFIKQRTIPLCRGGKPITEPEGVLERPLRAETMRGPRVTLAASEVVQAGATCSFDILVLPLGVKDKKMPVTEELLRSWLDYGALCGIGQWRTGSNGRFAYTMTAIV